MHRMALATVVLLLAGVALRAQPPLAASYDGERTIRLEGVVTNVAWVTPRASIFVNVRDGAGTTANWAIDVGNPLELERGGYVRGTVRVGDRVTIDASPARGIVNRALARSVTLQRTGARLFVTTVTPRTAAKAPAPRWPDGQVRLGPAPGRKGSWGRASASALVEGTAKVDMTADGLLRNLADAERVAPFMPWSKAVFLYRQRTRLADDPVGRCLPPGGPRQFLMPNGFQFVEQRELGRILVLHGGGNRNWRVIYTDGRPVGQPAEAVPSYYGYSVGRWEKDTLIVDSVGYNERFWLSGGGLPHTEALHLVERFTRPDLTTLRYEVTVDDARTYTRPWSGGWTLEWVADQELQEYFCEEGREP